MNGGRKRIAGKTDVEKLVKERKGDEERRSKYPENYLLHLLNH